MLTGSRVRTLYSLDLLHLHRVKPWDVNLSQLLTVLMKEMKGRGFHRLLSLRNGSTLLCGPTTNEIRTRAEDGGTASTQTRETY